MCHFVFLQYWTLVCIACAFVPTSPSICHFCSHIPWCVSAYISTYPGVCVTFVPAYPGVRHFVFRGLNLMCVAFCFSIYRTVMRVTLCSSTCMILIYITFVDVCRFVLINMHDSNVHHFCVPTDRTPMCVTLCFWLGSP